MQQRVEILSSSSDDEAPQPVKKAAPAPVPASPTIHEPSKLVGPPKPPAGTKLARKGRKAAGGAEVNAAAVQGPPKVVSVAEPVTPSKPTPPMGPPKSNANAAPATASTNKPTPPMGPPKSNANAAPATASNKPTPPMGPPKVQSAPAAAVSMPPLEEQEPSSDSEDDLPPPLEPLPIHAKKVDKKGPTKLLTGASPAPNVEKAENTNAQEEEEEETMIGPPRPAGKKAAKSGDSASKGASGIPAYLERDLSEFPLFMDKLPTERSTNPDIAALQDLAAEETKEQRAENFKQSGNECLTRSGLKYWDSAIEYYTRAIQCGSENMHNVSIYFSNRAAVQMLKKNWGHSIKDCLMALELDESNVKAMYRAAKSYYEVRKLPEALKYLKLAMNTSGKTKQLLELEKDIARRMRKERLQDEKKQKETEEALEKEMDVHKLYRERGYKFTGDDVYDVQPRLNEMGLKIVVEDATRRDAKEGEKEISFPVMVVYPQSRQSDFIARYPESFFMRDLLELFFREGEGQGVRTKSWEGHELYVPKEVGNMCVYLKTNDKFNTFEKQEFVRVKLSNTLQEALLCHPNYVIPVIPVFYVMHVSWKNTFFSKECQREFGAPVMKRDE